MNYNNILEIISLSLKPYPINYVGFSEVYKLEYELINILRLDIFPKRNLKKIVRIIFSIKKGLGAKITCISKIIIYRLIFG